MTLPGGKRLKRYDGSLGPTAIAVLLVVLGIFAGLALRPHPLLTTDLSNKPLPELVAVSPHAARKVFPLSVIHGGAYSKEELARARKTDGVVAAHYADFGSTPQFHKLSHDALLYVSYRRANQIYWSRTKHLIQKGETVISDGNCLARARCGNRLSTTAKVPVAPKEPVEEVLNTPEAPDEPVSYRLADLPGPAGRTFAFNLPSNFEAQTPGALASGRAPGATALAPGPGNYFASGPGGNGGGSGPVATGSKLASSTTAAVPAATSTSGLSSLPITTTGGSTLPTSSGYPVTGVTPGGVPTLVPSELVPEPASHLILLSGLAALWLSRRFRSGILRS